MITKVVYARLYNLGNYENERLEVEVAVERDAATAFAEARAAVEEQRARLEAAREEAAQREAVEWETKRQEQLAAIRAREAARDDAAMLQEADDTEDGDAFEDDEEDENDTL